MSIIPDSHADILESRAMWHVATVGPHSGFCFLQRFRLDIRQDDSHPLGCTARREPAADAAGGAGYHGDFVFECFHLDFRQEPGSA